MSEIAAGLDLGVRSQLLEELRQMAAGVDDGGRVLFVVGERGSGRSETLAEFAAVLRKDRRRPAVVCFRFDTAFTVVPVPAKAGDGRVSATFAAVGAVGSAAAMVPILAPSLVPVALLAQLAQALADSQSAARQLAALSDRREEFGEPDDLLATLRIACRAAPVICILDDFSRADLIWWRLFLRDGAAELARMPVLIVAAVDTTHLDAGLAARHEDLAGSLAPGFTSVVRVDPARAEEAEEQLGPIAEPLRTDLIDLVGGNAGLIGSLWRELLQDGAVELAHGRWRWRPGSAPGQGSDGDYLGFVRQAFDQRIRERCESQEHRDLAWAVVRMAAIEGARFTPEAVVTALHRIGHDGFEEVEQGIDFIDDVLGAHSGSPVIDLEEHATTWRIGGADRYVYQAGFVNRGHAEALRRFGLHAEMRAQWATALGFALEDVYAGAVAAISPVLVSVWEQAGEPARAASARKQGTVLVTEARLRSLMRAEAVGAIDRLVYVGYAVDHAARMTRSDPQRAIELGRSALEVAQQTRSSTAVATALLAMMNPLRALRHFADALPLAKYAAALPGVDPSVRWNVDYSLASCQLGIAECRCPIDHLSEAAAISENLQRTASSPSDRRSALAFTADLMTERKQFDQALPVFLECASAARSVGDLIAALILVRRAAFVLVEMRRFDDAIDVLRQAADLARQEGDSISAAGVRHEHAYALYQKGSLEESRALFTEIAGDWAELGSQEYLGGCLEMLELIARDLGQAALAAELREIVAVARMDEPERAARAEEDQDAAGRAAALRDLTPHLQRLHATAARTSGGALAGVMDETP
ncbi:hypothetical protein [Paractinoplanes maris]|uniref:hypothetical protein n=1 Tax=Paractinoplanes maris TaxID=1734446 RepID=UPI00201FED28|nr:hypothetical protein [Actinoplanes maris]